MMVSLLHVNNVKWEESGTDMDATAAASLWTAREARSQRTAARVCSHVINSPAHLVQIKRVKCAFHLFSTAQSNDLKTALDYD